MLRTIQIIALLQGFFLITVLVQRRAQYKRVSFWLLMGCIIAVLLYALGDDDFNLLVENSNWYLFYDPLLITMFFLLVRYHYKEVAKFQLKDYFFFIPYLLFIGFQLAEDTTSFSYGDTIILGFINITLLSYLLLTIRSILKNSKERWMLYFIIPYTVIFILDRVSYQVTGIYDSIPFIESYGVIGLSAFLFYIVLFKLITSPQTILPKPETTKYKTSSLNISNVQKYKEQLINLMEKEKLFKHSNISVIDVAQEMGIPRQHLSEVLNVHMKISFQEMVNQYRIEEFIDCLKSGDYKNYTLLGIANEVGFSSKSSFNTTFKKIKGMTPSQFKKQLK